ncbi:Small nuclear ribonucleoprotein E [Entamoeba marina]
MSNTKISKAMFTPIKFFMALTKDKQRVSVWLNGNPTMRIEGNMGGFDEFTNVVLTSAEEVHLKSGNKRSIGTIMLKGENIALISKIEPER